MIWQCGGARGNAGATGDKARPWSRLRRGLRQTPEHRAGILRLHRDSEGLVKKAGLKGQLSRQSKQQELAQRLPRS